LRVTTKKKKYHGKVDELAGLHLVDQGGLVFKAHRRLYHSTQGLSVEKEKEEVPWGGR
jgi:hypothetical protein